MKKILISGGNGKLSNCIKSYNTKYDIFAPNKKEMNVNNINQIEEYIIKSKCDYFIHAAALTRPMISHDNNPKLSIKTNIIGTSNVVLMCMKYNIKLIYISTDYVYSGDEGGYKETDPLLPFNKYGWSKLGGECAVKLYDNSLILRCCICDKPFPHDVAFVDVKKSYMYNDEVARIILKLLDQKGIINVGGRGQYVYDFVKKTRNDIKKISLKDIKEFIAKNTSMNISKMNKILNN